MANALNPTDPYLVHRFAIEVEGVLLAGFGELSGLQAQTEVFEYKEGGLNTYTHKLPTRTSYGNITLKWGATDSNDLWDWYEDSRDRHEDEATKEEGLDHPLRREARRSAALEPFGCVPGEVGRSFVQQRYLRGRHRLAGAGLRRVRIRGTGLGGADAVLVPPIPEGWHAGKRQRSA